MKKFYIFMLVFLTMGAFASSDETNVITKDLKAVLKQKSNQDLIRVNIRLKDQMNQMTRYAQLQNMKLENRRATVVNELKSYHKQSQADLMSSLSGKSSSSFKLIRQFWIANVVTALVDENTIYEIAQRSDIDRIDIDEERNLIETIITEPKPFIPADKGVNEITYNVTKVNADDVWDLGYTGEGVIVSVIDAGINYNHVDLEDHMWESAEYPNHGYDFYSDDNDPMDGHGHGTHCAGTVASDGTAGSQAGMAPDATLMACKVLADSGDGTESGVWAAIEFSVEQGAHIISMSLGWQHSWNPDRQTWRITYDNTLAAGVVAAVAAGNEGGSTNDPDDVRTPGDCPPPWLNPDQTLEGGISAVVCVGSTDQSDNLSSFSSRGPSDWSTIEPFFDYPFNPELGLIRPDVSAPGSNVKSCDAFNTNGYTTMSGTSMATPGVAGVMALLMSKNPGLTPEEICMILETTSLDLGSEGKDNLFGAGRIDAFQAMENTSEQGPVYEEHSFVDDNGNGELEAGESVLLNMTLFNGSDMDFSNVEVTVSTNSSYITMTDDTENYGDFASGEAVSIEEGFAFEIADNMPGQQNIRFNVVATDGTEVWESKFDVVSWGPNIFLGNMTISDEDGNNNGRLDPGESATIMIEANNSGQAEIENVELSIDYTGNYLTFLNTSVMIDGMPSDFTDYISFDVEVAEDANIGQADMFTANLDGGIYSDTKDYVIVIGLIVEDWETGDMTSFNWETGGNGWFVTEEDPYEGIYCLESTDIADNQLASFEIDYEVGTAGTISFFKKVSSEGNYDYLRFYIDGVEQDSWSGEVAWSYEEYAVNEGSHTFKWQYDKDGLVSSGADAAWVDFINFPPMSLPSIEMETEAIICAEETYTSDAVAENYESLMWSTNGDGVFDDEYMAEATYSPGTMDIENGMVELTLTASSANGDVNSKVYLSVMATEVAAPMMPEGMDNLCINPEDQSYATEMMMGYDMSWMLEPADAGVLVETENEVLIQWADDFVGQANLSVMAASVCAESEYSDALQIMVHDLPQLSMESDIDACESQEVMISGDLSGTAPWMIMIESYGEMTVETSPMEMSFMVHQDTALQILSVQDANGCLNEETIELNIVAHDVPEIELMDATACMNHEVVLDAGNSGADYEWSTGETSQTIMVDSAGMDMNNQKEISVMVTNNNDCSSEKSVMLTFEDCSGIAELGIQKLSIYPNPSNGIFEIEAYSESKQDYTLELLNLQGQLIYQEKLNFEGGSNKHQMDLSNLPPQNYLLVLRNKDDQVIEKIIIE